ncbi:MAG: hypothetical protein JF590_04610 [Gemmatimonadetes bacterium]|nr:hypothetical protein [Gemmatimonadota bacterium]
MRTLPLVSLLLLAACFGPKEAASPGARGRRPDASAADNAAEEAQALGRELFGIMDQVMSYKSSHFNNFPRDLPSMGIDSLTRTTIRRLTISGGTPSLAVVYRHGEGHAITQCVGTNKVIEDSMLNGGSFEVDCTLSSGESKAFTVGG